MVAKLVLTDWQCDKLLAGKYKGFFLDSYGLIDHLGVTETTTTYLAEDVGTGKRVAITLTPPDLQNYTVAELSA